MGRWGLVFVLPRRVWSRDLEGSLAVTLDGTGGHLNVVLSVLQQVLSHGVDPHFRLILADQDLVRLVLFGSKVVQWVLPDTTFSPASALVRGFLFVLLLDIVEWV